ncbi:MAG: ABC transporter ATP-binding protein, partial [Verrucomicrobia bacterium]|nr:ABC transporter ATP-binding protein [Verrucomicrobiota bacterium]
LGQLCGVIYAALNGAIPLLMKTVLGLALPETNVSQSAFVQHRGPDVPIWPGVTSGSSVLVACAAIPAIMLARGLFDYLSNYCNAWVSLKVLSDLRKRLFAHIISQSLDFFHRERAGNLISRVANDTRVAQNALGMIGLDLVKQPVCVLVGVAALLRLDARFTFIALVLFPLGILPIAVYGKRIRRTSKMEEQQTGAMTVILQETFAGVRVIKSFAREVWQNRLFGRLADEQFSNSMRLRRAAEIVGPLVEVVAAIGVGLALFYVHSAGMNLSKFISLVTGLFLLYQPAKQMSKLHVNIAKARAASEGIFELLEQLPTVRDRPGATALPERAARAGEIIFERVTFAYPNTERAALHDFSLRIAPGRYYALVGASGAGKSTVFTLLQRFYDPDAGRILLDGTDLRDLTQDSLRAGIGVVTQDTFLFHSSIADNIRYGRLDATDEDVRAAAKLAHAEDFIARLPRGFDTVVGDKGSRLSGGQQQRLAIARALLKNAPILLLDEATSALDSESERAVQEALETLAAGRTVVAIAHRLSTILKADEILVLDHGRIVERGTHSELLADANGIYRRLYDLQFGQEQAAVG